MKEISIKLNSIEHFYSEADKLESTGNKTVWENFHSGGYVKGSTQEMFVGATYREIMQRKYSYREGLDKLKEIEQDLNLGGSTKKFKYDEFDGDDVNYDRLLEYLPAFKKRIRTIGNSTGNIINLRVNIAENAFVEAEELMCRAYTVMRIIDYLENLGYRVGVYTYCDTYNPGSYKDEPVSLLHVEVLIKKPEEPLLKPLILTAISSWAFRYWMFKFRSAKIHVNDGFGKTAKGIYFDTKSNLYIRAGECLDEDSAEAKIMSIQKLYSDLLVLKDKNTSIFIEVFNWVRFPI